MQFYVLLHANIIIFLFIAYLVAVTGSPLCRDQVSRSFSSYFYGILQRGTAVSASRPAWRMPLIRQDQRSNHVAEE